MVDGCRGLAEAAVAQLVRRVADHDVEVHGGSKNFVDTLLDVVGVDEGVGVGFEVVASPVVVLSRAAVGAFAPRVDEDLVPGEWVYSTLAGATCPGVFGSFEPDVPVRGVKDGADRVLAISSLGAVDAPSSHQRSELGNRDPVHLFGEYVVNPLL